MTESHGMEDARRHIRTYLAIFGGLIVLTVVTVAVGGQHMAIWPALVVALSIAIVKGSMVAGWFMHLRTERPIIFRLLILTFVFLVAMFALFVAAKIDQQGVEHVS